MKPIVRAVLVPVLLTCWLAASFSAARATRADILTATPGVTITITSRPGTPTSTLDFVMPVQIASPQADGKVYHVVQSGQTLIMIARYYDVPVSQLYNLNKILPGNPTIYTGQKLLIKIGPPATLTFTPSSTPLPATATGTPEPSDTAMPPTLTPTETLQPSATPQSLFPQGGLFENIDRRSFGMGIIAACILGLAFVGISAFLRRR